MIALVKTTPKITEESIHSPSQAVIAGGRQQDVNEGRVELKQEALPFGGTAASGYLIRTEPSRAAQSPPIR